MFRHSEARTRHCYLARPPGAFPGAGTPPFTRNPSRHKFILKLSHKTLHGPGAGFTEGANRPAAGDVVGDSDQVIGVRFAALAVSEAVEGLAQPERAFAA